MPKQTLNYSPKELERFFKALANERRIKILWELWEHGSQNVGQVSKNIELSYRSTSKHLQKLEKAGLLTRRRRKFSVIYGPKDLKNEPEKKRILQTFLKSLQIKS